MVAGSFERYASERYSKRSRTSLMVSYYAIDSAEVFLERSSGAGLFVKCNTFE